MKTSKEIINEAIIALGFNLDSLNYDYCNVVESCGNSNNIPTLVKCKNGDTKVYGNVNITLRKVADLPISMTVSIGVNIKKKYSRNWDFKHEMIIPNCKLNLDNLESVRKDIWDEVRRYRNNLQNG